MKYRVTVRRVNIACYSSLRNFLSLSDIITSGNPQSVDMKNFNNTFTQSMTDHVIFPRISLICFVYLSVMVKTQSLLFARCGSPKMKSSVMV